MKVTELQPKYRVEMNRINAKGEPERIVSIVKDTYQEAIYEYNSIAPYDRKNQWNVQIVQFYPEIVVATRVITRGINK